MRFFSVLVSILFTFNLTYAQRSTSLTIESKPDVEASFPGSISNFYEQVHLLINYPIIARYQGIEGKCFIEFIINSKGRIEKESIKTIQSLSPECDEEAERAVSLIATEWLPAKKGGKPVNSRMVLPIVFKLSDNFSKGLPVRTIIITKESKSSSFGWDVYENTRMNAPNGRVLPGDSVSVIGFAPYLLLITKDSLIGYVPYKSVKIIPELQELITFLKENSYKLENAKEKADSTTKQLRLNTWKAAIELNDYNSKNQNILKKKADSIELIKSSSVFFSSSVSKNEVYVGECSVLSLAFFVNDDNLRPLRFYNLGIQVQEMTSTKLVQKSSWSPVGRISDIEGNQLYSGSKIYTTYKIYSASYCPVKAEPISFGAINLTMQEFNPSNRKENFLTTFTSNQLNIRVKPLPEGIKPTYSNGTPLVGKFILNDSLSSDSIYAGIPVRYQIKVLGAGLLYPIEPIKFNIGNLKSRLMTTEYADTTINDFYYSVKTFIYQFIFEKPGIYDLADQINYRAFDPEQKRVVTLSLSRKVSVVGKTDIKQSINSYFDESLLKDKLIAIDASTSMMIEDYIPTRLEVVKAGLNNFLQSKSSCDLNLIVFGGNTIVLPSRKDSCYTNSMVNRIDHKMVIKGTSMGEVIWLAGQNISDSAKERILVIISDGDNTSGVLTPEAAISMLASSKLKIHTIGIGKSGVVPFGKDYFGRQNLVENTFSDVLLKKISSQTGGKYYLAKDEKHVSDILRQIFSN